MHDEYIRIVDGAETAVLFIHGIIGTPRHFDSLISLVPQNISVYNMLLDGHGKGVADFSHTSMKKWEMQVSDTVDSLLSTHKRLFIVAHSMGTLFAIEEAIRRSEITGLFLLAVPIKLLIKPKMISNSLKVYSGRISPDDKYAVAAKNCYGIGQDKNILKYVGWIPRYLELFSKIREVRGHLDQLHTPTTAIQSYNDEMVSRSSVKILDAVKCMSVSFLKSSSHYYYEERDYEFILQKFTEFINRRD